MEKKLDSLSSEPSKAIVERKKDGRLLRRMTIYLDVKLARKLRVHCAERDIEISKMIADAVKRVLDSTKK